MVDFTYETKNTDDTLETYEWDNIWYEQAPKDDKARALVIGDSISCGYRRKINDILHNKMYVDGYGTSKALDNPYFIETARLVIHQQRHTKLIQFNNGLHGWHLSLQQYKLLYVQMIRNLIKLCPNAKIIIALTTPVRDKDDLDKFDARNEIVLQRNEIATQLAARHGFYVNDFYTPLASRPDLFLSDGVHLNQNGYEQLAKQCGQVFI